MLWSCKGTADPAPANPSAANQLRRSGLLRSIARTSASLQPKPFEKPLAFLCQQIRGAPNGFALQAIPFRVIRQKVRLGMGIAIGDLCRCKSNVLYERFRVIC